MPAGYDEEEERRRAREREIRESNADGTSRGYRGGYEAGENPWGANYDSYDYYGYSAGVDDGVSGHDETAADIPLYGWLSGASARRDAGRAQAESERQRLAWLALARSAPTAEDLTPEYYLEGGEDQWGDLRGGPSEVRGGSQGLAGQYDALSALREIANAGGYTRADEMARNQAAMANAQRLGGANQAAIQQMNARGLGGGGAELAARMMGSQAYTQGQAMADAQIQSGAMQRAMQALQGMGAIGGSIDQNELRRQSALDAFNQRQMDWRRNREQRNTAWANRQQDSRSQARQTSYEAQERALAGATNQWSAAGADRRHNQSRQDQANRDLGAGLGTIISEIL